MYPLEYTTFQSLYASLQRDARGLDLNENDVFEWIGEALDSARVYSTLEEHIYFGEVKEHILPFPPGLRYIIQIARDTQWEGPQNVCSAEEIVSSINETVDSMRGTESCASCEHTRYIEVDCQGYPVNEYEEIKSPPKPYSLENYYQIWSASPIYRQRFIPVVLANHTFYKSIVCRTENPYQIDMLNSEDRSEYNLLDRQFLFSFKSGYVAISYVRIKIGEDGLPLIPDDFYLKEALKHFVLYKVKQREAYLHKEGSRQMAQMSFQLWRDYIGRFKSSAKMPTDINQYLGLREQQSYMIPPVNNPYDFYRNLGTPEPRRFNS